jgi:cytochrome c553
LFSSASAFVWDDPNTWQPPSSLASDIAAGKSLWSSAPLVFLGGVRMLAHCGDCHAQEGRDLKYFNYSNNSIRTRSQFHGLSAQQGDQIASYIRSLNLPNPGRPWNPPYQPGPGLDSQPVQNWAAGAGLDAVLKRDADMLPYLMPGGSAAQWAPSANMSAREIPVMMQLPDWNMWLPGIHPMDAWGSAFLSSTDYTNYLYLRANLVPNDANTFGQYKDYFNIWIMYERDFLGPLTKTYTDPAWNDPHYYNSIVSTRMWNMTKMWEVSQEFGLEGMGQIAFGPTGDTRAWNTNEPFFASPNMLKLPWAGNGLEITYRSLSMAWYHLQLVLNYSNNKGTGLAEAIDFGYVYNHIENLTYVTGCDSLSWPLHDRMAHQSHAGL